MDISGILAGLYQVLRNHDVSYEGISGVMNYLIPQSRDTIRRRFSNSIASVQLPETSSIQIIHYDEQHPKAGKSQKYRLTEAQSFSPIVQRRLEKIQMGWIHFTAFQRVDDAPATNNAIENYYSTSLKGQKKKQLRTDRVVCRIFCKLGGPVIPHLNPYP